MLSRTEDELADCETKMCDSQELMKELYYTIPESIHATHVEHNEMRRLRQMNKTGNPLTYPELIAYPNRAEYIGEPTIYRHSVDPSSFNTYNNVVFDPPMADFGIWYE